MAIYAEVKVACPEDPSFRLMLRYAPKCGYAYAGWHDGRTYLAKGSDRTEADDALKARYGANNVHIYERS